MSYNCYIRALLFEQVELSEQQSLDSHHVQRARLRDARCEPSAAHLACERRHLRAINKMDTLSSRTIYYILCNTKLYLCTDTSTLLVKS